MVTAPPDPTVIVPVSALSVDARVIAPLAVKVVVPATPMAEPTGTRI